MIFLHIDKKMVNLHINQCHDDDETNITIITHHGAAHAAGAESNHPRAICS